AVLVHPHDEVDRLALQTAVACHRVGADLLERVPHVRRTVGVVDRCRDVVGLLPAHALRPFPFLSLTAAATSALRSARSTVRRFPSSSLRSTRSRQMSTLMTRSVPRSVVSVLPSRGNFFRACTYDSCS